MKLMRLWFLGFVAICLASCVSQKRLTYLQEDTTQENDTIYPIRKMQEPYRLQVNDLLSIRVKALDQETVGIFNPISDESRINANREERLYFDGFVVDVHGNIRIPALGDVNVLGYLILINKLFLIDVYKILYNSFPSFGAKTIIPGILLMKLISKMP